jgi:hypothetical protein
MCGSIVVSYQYEADLLTKQRNREKLEQAAVEISLSTAQLPHLALPLLALTILSTTLEPVPPQHQSAQ